MGALFHPIKMAPNQSTGALSVGDSVADTEDDDPDEALVLERPAEQTIADWEYETASGSTTTAEENPEYSADDQLVIVAFRAGVAEAIDDWQALDEDALFEAVAEHDINRYGFPESRLEKIEPGELEAEWLDSLAERFTDAGWEVTHDTTELIVTQYDEEYRITADGTVEGDGQYREPLENIVELER
jgi:hypothetical protein